LVFIFPENEQQPRFFFSIAVIEMNTSFSEINEKGIGDWALGIKGIRHLALGIKGIGGGVS
jgi:hypothetical protein